MRILALLITFMFPVQRVQLLGFGVNNQPIQSLCRHYGGCINPTVEFADGIWKRIVGRSSIVTIVENRPWRDIGPCDMGRSSHWWHHDGPVDTGPFNPAYHPDPLDFYSRSNELIG